MVLYGSTLQGHREEDSPVVLCVGYCPASLFPTLSCGPSEWARPRVRCWRQKGPSKDTNPWNMCKPLGRQGIEAPCSPASTDAANTWKQRAEQ